MSHRSASVGIDVSSQELVVAIHGVECSATFENTAQGRRTLVKYVKKKAGGKVRVLLESTGTYGLDLALELHKQKRFEVAYLNPAAVKGFLKAGLVRAKTDKADARALAHMAALELGALWTPPSEHALQLRGVMRFIRSMVNERTRHKNRLAAMKATKTTAQFLVDELKDLIDGLDDRIQRLRKHTMEFALQDGRIAEDIGILQSTKGIADVLSLDIVAEISCLPQDISAAQLVACAGLDPRVRQSGRVDAPRRISKMGSKYLRVALYMAAINAVRHDESVRSVHQAFLDRGKKPLVAYTAIARRLLVCFHVILKRREQFDGSRFGNACRTRNAA